ncbi:MAG: hypothetical protein GX601_17880 [Anaerolineales bacterium]|nr:hypothetical protein [Anaerolineales bacterium]
MQERERRLQVKEIATHLGFNRDMLYQRIERKQMTKNDILYSTDKPTCFIPATVEFDGDGHGSLPGEVGVSVTSVNYSLADLTWRAEAPS